MAILLVKIEDKNSLALNEFFDYMGVCYASTRSRMHPEKKTIDMTSFYEATINTQTLPNIPVVFVSAAREATILGWYKKAEIYSQMQNVSFFLEGNIKAYAFDAVWLPADNAGNKISWFGKDDMYEVIEEEDSRYNTLNQLIQSYAGKNQMLHYHNAQAMTSPKELQDSGACLQACQRWASRILSEECQDIRDLKTLETYAKKLTAKEPKNPDGYYYLALACYQLGFVKEGLKQINKAIQLEPQASDLTALKGMLLVSRGYPEDGAAHLHQAYEQSQEEDYLLMEGRAYMMAGKIDKAYDCFNQIEDKELLEQSNITLKDMEKKWSFIKARGLKFMELFHKK